MYSAVSFLVENKTDIEIRLVFDDNTKENILWVLINMCK